MRAFVLLGSCVGSSCNSRAEVVPPLMVMQERPKPEGGPCPSQPAAFVSDPTFSANDNPDAPQVGLVRFELDRAACADVEVNGGDEQWTVHLASAKSVEAPILGLAPDTDYTVRVRLGDVVSEPVQWRTPPLPLDFPSLDVTAHEPDAMEPGMTLFATRVGAAAEQGTMVVVDNDGVVRWYYSDSRHSLKEDVRRLDDGHFLFLLDHCSIGEFDATGRLVGAWYATRFPAACDVPVGSVPVDVWAFHHEVSLLENGNFLTLSLDETKVPDYPSSEDDADAPRQRATIFGAIIVEFTRDGSIVKQIALADLLDTTRIGRDSLSSAWCQPFLAKSQDVYDWDHANAVAYDAGSDAYYVSLRHQDAIVKIDRETEKLVWILGTPANWAAPWANKLLSADEGFVWPFHQHSVQVRPDIEPLGLSVYDNGNNRAPAYEPPIANYTRAVAFAIDESEMKVSKAWSYGEAPQEPFFSPAMGDADFQPITGNTLLVNAQLSTGARNYAQILEVTSSGDAVFQLDIGKKAGPSDPDYSVYRAQRIADLRK